MRPRSHRGLGLVAVVAVLSCVWPATQALVVIDTDVPAGMLLTVTATVRRGNAIVDGAMPDQTWVRGTGTRQISLPASFGIVPEDGPRDASVIVLVEGRLATATISRLVRFRFTPNTTGVLRVFLTARCLAPATGCTAIPAAMCTMDALCRQRGEQCGNDGRCVPVDTPLEPRGDGGLGFDVERTDGGVDAAADSPVDVPTEASISCGNMAMDPGEECDDGNTAPWDGCSPTCRFEQTLRATQTDILPESMGCNLVGGTGIDNVTGRALGTLLLDAMNANSQNRINSGQNITLMMFLDLDDPLGQTDPMLRLGSADGRDFLTPFDGTRGESLLVRATQLDAMRNLLSIESPVSIVGGMLTGTDGTLYNVLSVNTATSSPINIRRARVTGRVVADAMMRRIDSITNGLICGGVSAADLDGVGWPSGIPMGCAPPAGNPSLLDMVVAGCSVAGVPVVRAVQPDFDLGGDGLFTGGSVLQDTDGDRIVDRCRDTASGVIINGNDCAQDPAFDDGFTSAVRFAAIRVQLAGIR